jgi:hypothetical protein
VERYRITIQRGDAREQTWVLLPDAPSAEMQARELGQREKQAHVRVYRETADTARELRLDLPPRLQ